MRQDKTVSLGRHHDVYRSFYTTDDRLVSYMISLLAPRDGDACMEPSAGSGCFIDGLLATHKDLKITAVELSTEAANCLRQKYRAIDSVEVMERDFLMDDVNLFDGIESVDRIIGNPPYGGWQDYGKREYLRKRFPNLYVRETYGLFVAQSLRKLRRSGRLVFILPETFLYLHLQKGLRKLIVENYRVQSIDVFPSSVFPGVRFGYAKLCIVVIDNTAAETEHHVVIRHSSTVDELKCRRGREVQVRQSSILLRHNYEFPLSGHTAETALIDSSEVRLGDISDCVTGLYTGNDKRFLRRAPSNPQGKAKYDEIDPMLISRSCSNLKGLSTPRTFIPILKGGGIPYVKPEVWFVDWGTEAVSHYRTDPKSRFQNSGFYFRHGIGFPMVTSKRATASIIRDHWMFDQSIVGVFPKHKEHFGYILALLNSSVCWRFLRTINPSANNSAKYLRRLPILLPSPADLSWFNDTVESYTAQLIDGAPHNDVVERELEQAVEVVYGPALQGS